jgi:hypothetical protein
MVIASRSAAADAMFPDGPASCFGADRQGSLRVVSGSTGSSWTGQADGAAGVPYVLAFWLLRAGRQQLRPLCCRAVWSTPRNASVHAKQLKRSSPAIPTRECAGEAGGSSIDGGR